MHSNQLLQAQSHLHRIFQEPSNIAAVIALLDRASNSQHKRNINLKGRTSLDPTIMQLPSWTCNTGLRCRLLIALIIFCNTNNGGNAVRSFPAAATDLRTTHEGTSTKLFRSMNTALQNVIQRIISWVVHQATHNPRCSVSSSN